MSIPENFGEQVRNIRDRRPRIQVASVIDITKPEHTALIAAGLLDEQGKQELMSGVRPAEEVLSDSERNARIGIIIDSPAFRSARRKIREFVHSNLWQNN